MSWLRSAALGIALGALACSEAAPGPAALGVAGNAAAAGASGAAGDVAVAGAVGMDAAGLGGAAGALSAGGAGQGGTAGAALGGAGGAGGMGGSGPIVSGDGPPSSRQSERPLGSTAAAQGFFEYLPPGYGDGTLRPLLLFFHGGGERGNGTTDLAKLLVHGPPWLISKEQWPAERPFIVLSPQHSSDIGGCPDADEVNAFLTFALANYAVDPKRVSLTGLSCGGHAIWRYLGKYGGHALAASVPICGDGREPWTLGGCIMGQAALWAFHGGSDPTVLPVGTTEPVGHLLYCPTPPRQDIQLNNFPGVQHESRPPVNDGTAGHDIYAWMLEHTAQ